MKLGEIGEKLSADLLKKQGFRIVAAGWRCELGEIDLIVMRKGALYFVEVKSRSSLKFGRPAEAVNIAKQRKIRQVAEYFLQQNHFSGEIWLAVMEVLYDKDSCKYYTNFIPSAF